MRGCDGTWARAAATDVNILWVWLYIFLVVFEIIMLLINKLGIKIYILCNLFENSYWKWKEVHSTLVNNYLCIVGVIACEHTRCDLIIIISY